MVLSLQCCYTLLHSRCLMILQWLELTPSVPWKQCYKDNKTELYKVMVLFVIVSVVSEIRWISFIYEQLQCSYFHHNSSHRHHREHGGGGTGESRQQAQLNLGTIWIQLLCFDTVSIDLFFPQIVRLSWKTARKYYSAGGIIALGVFGGFVFLAAIITTIVILIRRWVMLTHLSLSNWLYLRVTSHSTTILGEILCLVAGFLNSVTFLTSDYTQYFTIFL